MKSNSWLPLREAADNHEATCEGMYTYEDTSTSLLHSFVLFHKQTYA